MYVLLIGPPGAGKGTQARRLVKVLQIAHLSTGDMLREVCQRGGALGKEVADCLSQGRLLSDELVVDIVRNRLAASDCRRGCLLDGFPRTLDQAEALDGLLQERRGALDMAIELRADEAELTRRMLQRAQLEGRSDDCPETIRRRLQVYRLQTAPLLKFYARRGQLQTVDGLGAPDEVFERIMGCLPVKQVTC